MCGHVLFGQPDRATDMLTCKCAICNGQWAIIGNVLLLGLGMLALEDLATLVGAIIQAEGTHRYVHVLGQNIFEI